MPITFLHAADIHLDSPLKGLEQYENAPVDRIRGATRRAFTKLIDLALEQRVQFVLIAGDLHDGDWRDNNTNLFLAGQLGRLRGASIPVFIISGNHDAHNNTMTKARRLPDNVRLLAHDRPETVHVAGLDVAIHGQSFARRDVYENLAAAYPAAVPGCVNIGLLHTGLTGEEGHARYAPCSVEDLRSRGYDYWALGHVHTRQNPCLDPLVVFPGNIQGRHIRETGEKGCVLATVTPGDGVATTFHRLDVVRWERARVDLSGVDVEDDVLNRVAHEFDSLLQSEPDRLLAVRVVLHGVSSLNDQLRAQTDHFVNEIRGQARAWGEERLWVEKVEIQTRAERPIIVTDGPIAALVEELNRLRADPAELADELAALKRSLPIELTSGDDALNTSDPEWLGGLLQEVQPLLFNLLQRGGEAHS